MFFLNDFYQDLTKDNLIEDWSVSKDPSKLFDLDS